MSAMMLLALSMLAASPTVAVVPDASVQGGGDPRRLPSLPGHSGGMTWPRSWHGGRNVAKRRRRARRGGR